MGYNLLINEIYWGYDPFTNHSPTSLDIQVCSSWIFWIFPSSGADGQQLWVPLLEKAYAKVPVPRGMARDQGFMGVACLRCAPTSYK